MSIGFRILPCTRKVSSAQVQAFAKLPVANVSDAMHRMTAGGADLKPIHRGSLMAGPAITVKTRPGDNLLVHKALDLAEPGDVVVVDGGGESTNALIGELMVAHAIKRGLGGIVVYGAIRDFHALSTGDFPVFAKGVTHRGPYKDGPGEINVPVSINGMVIAPGDLILGDHDGLLCVPYDEAEAVYAGAKAKFDAEQISMAEIRAGKSHRAWIDASLNRLKCEIVG
jgi:RraA family protein